MSEPQIIQADWTYLGGRFVEGVQVVVKADGRIAQMGAMDLRPTRVLKDRALLPGLINVHSHAFQRGMRGLGEQFPRELLDETAARGDFWSWRQAMYRLVLDMDERRMYELTRQAFEEMLACGITTVGEFHYLHHDARGESYALDDVVLQAARDAGIRLVLLYTHYRTGGIGLPLAGGQLRFHTPSPREYWKRVDEIAPKLDARTQSLGAVVHSIRAASIEDLVEIHRESQRRKLVFHMHVEEQPKEIEDCRAAYGRTPMSVVNERLAVDDRFTAVHCTHTAKVDMTAFLKSGGRVCLCPLTEANLGDGIADVRHILESGGRVCIGSDLNSRLCMAEELRLVEYAQRLRSQRRGCVADAEGNVARPLLDMATRHGAESLAIDAGAIEPGRLADFFTLDLTAPALRGWTPQTLPEAFIFGTSESAVSDVCVGGVWRRPAD
ncbi:MAG: formimidoylglutamate deiminase [Phycisphaerales bacterium]|nr:formimidoylglutamate deiminase [Phycisphaerales bacterium]